ncbi:MAG: amidohydrolase family protein [Bacteroidales bacterium]|jgi:cytosine/adenosine deaminase-related metal-dependent hydrolase|nr:amidohydrolase family protein [Bacteroidales bacterium]
MILLKNGTYIDWQTLEFKNTDLLVQAGRNGKIRFPGITVKGETIRTIDCTGKFITKSFANGHHHVYSALARGMNSPKKNPENFLEILKYIWWTLDKALDPEIIRSSALVTAIACAKNGVTFVIDHHASPFAVKGSLEIIARAFDEVGVNHLLCYEISDRDGSEIAQKGLVETADYLSKRQGLVGLHASFTVGERTLQQSVEIASGLNSGIHIHVAENQSDQEHCLTHYHKRVMERLADAGVLQFPKSILAHCLHLNENERAIAARSPAWIVENMESNLNNSVGFFNSKGLNRNIMFGTDGMHSDMLTSAKSAFFAGHNYEAIDYGETYRRFRNVHHYLRNNGFTGDEENNLVVFDYDTPTPFTKGNFLSHFLFGIGSKHVTHVISNGELIVEDRNVVTVNEVEILAEARLQAERLWGRMK